MRDLLKLPPGKRFVPYRDRDQLQGVKPKREHEVILGKGFDQRLLGWLMPQEVFSESDGKHAEPHQALA